MLDHGALPACLFYKGYRHTVCTSLNHVVCHGIPGERVLSDGDIVNIDVTVIVDGWHGDTSRMYAVGEVPRKAMRLMDVTYEGMMRGIDAIKPGARLGDLGHAIQEHAEASATRSSRVLRPRPRPRLPRRAQHPALRQARSGRALQPGMIFTVEPMLNLGSPDVKVLADGWTAVTRTSRCRRSTSTRSASPKPASRSSRFRRPASTRRTLQASRPDDADGGGGKSSKSGAAKGR